MNVRRRMPECSPLQFGRAIAFRRKAATTLAGRSCSKFLSVRNVDRVEARPPGHPVARHLDLLVHAPVRERRQDCPIVINRTGLALDLALEGGASGRMRP